MEEILFNTFWAFSSSLLHAIISPITCPFSNYLKMLYIFPHISKYFALFSSFSEKLANMPLLSRIGPDIKIEYNKAEVFWVAIKFFQKQQIFESNAFF